MPVKSASNRGGRARASARKDASSRCRISTWMPMAPRSDWISCSTALSPLPTVRSVEVERNAPSRARAPVAARRQPAASSSESARAVSSAAVAGARERTVRRNRTRRRRGRSRRGRATMRRRSIASEIARRTRASSNGGARTLKTMPVRQQNRIFDDAQRADRGARAPPSSARSRRHRARRSRARRISWSASSTTRSTSAATFGGPPSAAGKASLRANTHRSPAAARRSGTGRCRPASRLNAARRMSARGTDAEQVRGDDRQLAEDQREIAAADGGIAASTVESFGASMHRSTVREIGAAQVAGCADRARRRA